MRVPFVLSESKHERNEELTLREPQGERVKSGLFSEENDV